MPLTVVLSPKLAGWNSSVGASIPASHPASAGMRIAIAPASRRRVQRVTCALPRFTPWNGRIVAGRRGPVTRGRSHGGGGLLPGTAGRARGRAGAGPGDPAGEFAEPSGRTRPDWLPKQWLGWLRPSWRWPVAVVAAPWLVPPVAAGDPLDGAVCVADAVACGLECCADGALLAAPADGWLLFALVDGPKVATESMAPATRHTARMLASSGMTVPVPAERGGQLSAACCGAAGRAAPGGTRAGHGRARARHPESGCRAVALPALTRRQDSTVTSGAIGPLPPSITPRNDFSCRGLPDASGRLEVDTGSLPVAVTAIAWPAERRGRGPVIGVLTCIFTVRTVYRHLPAW